MVNSNSFPREEEMIAPAENKATVIKRILVPKQKLASLGVAIIGLFGSFKRDEPSSSSDVDFLVEFEPDKHSFDNFMEVSFFLEELLGRRVEVVTPDALSHHIGPHILREVEHVDISA
jgi:predicted nucleotidyltransferase